METAAILAVISAITTLVTTATSMYQSDNEYSKQRELLSAEQDYQSQREDIAFERSMPDVQFNAYKALGFNPNLAANAILGGSGQTFSSSGSPSAAAPNSAIGALTQALGHGGQQLQDAFVNQAQIANLNADTEKKTVEAGIMPREYQLRRLSTEAQIKVWNKSVDKIVAEQKLDEEQARMIREQRLYYGQLTNAQIEAYKAQVLQACATAVNQYAQSETESHRQANLDANTAVQYASEENIRQDTVLKFNQSNRELYASDRERIAKEFEEAIGGVPLSADANKMITDWANNGEYDKIQAFYQAVFTTAQSQEIGQTLGSPRLKLGLPFGLLQYESQRGPVYNMYNNPYWNPNLRGASGEW